MATQALEEDYIEFLGFQVPERKRSLVYSLLPNSKQKYNPGPTLRADVVLGENTLSLGTRGLFLDFLVTTEHTSGVRWTGYRDGLRGPIIILIGRASAAELWYILRAYLRICRAGWVGESGGKMSVTGILLAASSAAVTPSGALPGDVLIAAFVYSIVLAIERYPQLCCANGPQVKAVLVTGTEAPSRFAGFTRAARTWGRGCIHTVTTSCGVVGWLVVNMHGVVKHTIPADSEGGRMIAEVLNNSAAIVTPLAGARDAGGRRHRTMPTGDPTVQYLLECFPVVACIFGRPLRLSVRQGRKQRSRAVRSRAWPFPTSRLSRSAHHVFARFSRAA